MRVGAFEIDELGVTARARGTGLGRSLLRLVTDAREHSWLLTWGEAHDTIDFYRHVGWYEPRAIDASGDVIVFTSSQESFPTGEQPADSFAVTSILRTASTKRVKSTKCCDRSCLV